MNPLETALTLLAATSWRIGLLIVLCLGLRRVLRGRLPASAVFAVWLVLAGALLVPVGIPARWSPFGLVPRIGSAAPSPAPVPVALVESLELRVEPIGAFTIPDGPVLTPAPLVTAQPAAPSLIDRLKEIPASRWATLAWLAGVMGLVVRRVAALMIFSRKLRRSLAPADARTASVVERCRELLGIQGEVTSGVTSLVETPALHGILRPKLLMPVGMAGRLSDAELELVVLHELGHVRRRDLLAQTLIHAAAVLHWFNPLAWLAAHAARADCEHACDEFVLSRVEEDRREDYGAVLLKVVGLGAGPGRLPAVLGIFESKKQLQHRIHLIAGYSSPHWIKSVAGAALLTVIALVGLTRESVGQQAPVAAATATIVPAAEMSSAVTSTAQPVPASFAQRQPVENPQWSFTPGWNGVTVYRGPITAAMTPKAVAAVTVTGAAVPAMAVEVGAASRNITIRVTAEGSLLVEGERVGLDEFVSRLRQFAADSVAGGTPGRVRLEADESARFSQVFGYVANEVRKVNVSQVDLVAAADPASPLMIEAAPVEAANTRGTAVVQVSANGSVFLNQEPLSQAALEERLLKGRADGTITAVRIAGDRQGLFQDVLRVVDIVRKVGIAKLSVETRTSSTGQAGGETAAPAATSQTVQSLNRYPAERGPNGVTFRRASVEGTTANPVSSPAQSVQPDVDRSIRLVAIRSVRVQVNVRNADGSNGAVLLASEIPSGERRVVPWSTALNITVSEGANLQIEVNGTLMPIGFIGYNQGWLPAPDDAGGWAGGLTVVPAPTKGIDPAGTIVARVGDVVITAGDVARELQGSLQDIRSSSVDQQDYMAKVAQAQAVIVQKLVDRQRAIQEFRQLKPGMQEIRRIPEAFIEQEIAETERVQFGGDRARLLAHIQSLGLTREEYRRRVEDDIIFRTMLTQRTAPAAGAVATAQAAADVGSWALGPTFAVAVQQTVTVLGQVKKTGKIELPAGREVQVMELIAMAGGFTDMAKRSAVKLTRVMPDGTQKTWEVDVDALVQGLVNPFSQPTIQPGDIVNVPMRIF